MFLGDWINRLDAKCRPLDARYEAWLKRWLSPAFDSLLTVWLPIVFWLITFAGLMVFLRSFV